VFLFVGEMEFSQKEPKCVAPVNLPPSKSDDAIHRSRCIITFRRGSGRRRTRCARPRPLSRIGLRWAFASIPIPGSILLTPYQLASTIPSSVLPYYPALLLFTVSG
jgi:hypothetical protein